MYTYQTALGLARGIGGQWGAIDATSTTLKVLFLEYEDVVLTLTNPVLPQPVYVSLASFRASLSASSLTLTQWLLGLGETTLPTIPALPDAAVRYVGFYDARQYGYSVDVPIPGMTVPSDYPESAMAHLRLTRNTSPPDFRVVESRSLVTLNGFIHATLADPEVLYIANGVTSLQVAPTCNVGLWSFWDFGELQKIPITPAMLSGSPTGEPYQTRLYVETNRSFVGYTPLLVLGGYLVPPGHEVFWPVNTNTVAVTPNALPLLQRYFESRPYLDLSPLQLTLDPVSPEVINQAEFWSNAVLTRYFTLSQSFLVLVPTQNLFVAQMALRRHPWPNVYTSGLEPVYPLSVGYGRCPEYWKTYEEGQWALNLDRGLTDRFVLNELRLRNSNATSQRYPFQPTTVSGGALLKIGGYANN